jgi:glycosyltransferase involved in cell wall biosynthesis
MAKPLHIHHVFSSFNLGGLESRTCTLMSLLGDEFCHTITATDGGYAAAARIAPGVRFELVDSPAGKGTPLYPFRFSSLLRAVQPDLLVTYNWGAFDAALAATVDSICPVVHTEDGFNPDEATRLKSRRVWARRLVLNQISAVVVPSRTLRDIALNTYHLRAGMVHWIPNGVEPDQYGTSGRERWRADWGCAEDEFLIGFVGRLSAEKNLGLLLRAVAACRLPNARIVLVGRGPCQAELETLAGELGIGGRVTFAGFIPDPSGCYGAFDLFAMSSATEQMPISLLEAMAAGLPVICTTVGDCAEILGNPGWPSAVPAGDLDAYVRGLGTLHADAELRERLGARNRRRCVESYSREKMIARYRHIYLAAAGRSEPAANPPAHSRQNR